MYRWIVGGELLFLIGISVSGVAYSADIEPKGVLTPETYVCYRTAVPMDVDGKLDEVSWGNAPWTAYFVDIEGELKPKPRFKTRAKMLWDDDYFYVAAEMEEPDVWATLVQRDAVIFHDNDFEVFIDPDGDTHEYYEFEMNAFNTVWDLFLVKPYRDGGPAIVAWDIAGLKTAVDVQGTLNQPGNVDRGWSVEVAFPWHVLRECAHRPTPPKDGDQWRVNFSRVEYYVDVVDKGYQKRKNPETQQDLPEDNWVWSPQGLVNMHYPEMWGYVQFSTVEAGTDTVSFVLHPEEEAKMLLRKVYYRERMYHEQYHAYTDDFYRLGLSDLNSEHYTWPPVLQITDSLFEAWVEEKEDLGGDGRIDRWHIRQDSKVWKDP